MKIGFIGAGNVGQTMGRHFINAGHQVVISNSRGPESLQGLVDELGPRAKAGVKEEAVRSVARSRCTPLRTRPALDATAPLKLWLTRSPARVELTATKERGAATSATKSTQRRHGAMPELEFRSFRRQSGYCPNFRSPIPNARAHAPLRPQICVALRLQIGELHHAALVGNNEAGHQILQRYILGVHRIDAGVSFEPR